MICMDMTLDSDKRVNVIVYRERERGECLGIQRALARLGVAGSYGVSVRFWGRTQNTQHVHTNTRY